MGDKNPSRFSTRFIKDVFPTFLRSSIIGAFIGFLPGAGATAASFVAYGWEVRSSRHPEKYGTGEPRGVVASETANNASYGGAMIPMLTMGIPGSACTAVILGVLLLKGIQPSPIVFQKMPDLIYAIFVTMILTKSPSSGFSGERRPADEPLKKSSSCSRRGTAERKMPPKNFLILSLHA